MWFWRSWSYLAHKYLLRFAVFVFGRALFLGELSGRTIRTLVDGRGGLAGVRSAARTRTPLTDRLSPPIGRAKQRAKVGPEHEQHRLAVQPVRRRLVGRTGGHRPTEKADFFERPDRAAHPRLGES